MNTISTTMNDTTHGQIDMLQAAGSMLEWYDNRDRQKPGLLELTGISQHGRPTMSGLNDFDYQTLGHLTADHTNKLQQVRSVTKTAVPSEILEHFNHMKCHCTMGLLPEIGRAYLTIDSEIYIWTYDQERDVAYYDGLTQVIVSVGLVKPKPNVFVDHVKYLLLLTTPIEIIVLGVTFGPDPNCNVATTTSPSQHNELQLMNKPIFVIATDNVSINVVQGTEDGRIFLGGGDGCLYEIYYQAESSWFGRRCKKINLSQSIVSYMVPSFLKVFASDDHISHIAIDNSRKLLYVLTEKSCIEAWELGGDYSVSRRLGRITQSEIVSQATNLIKTVDPSVFKHVKALCPLKADDSSGLHLIAVTQCGVRLYFSTNSFLGQPPQIGGGGGGPPGGGGGGGGQVDQFGLGTAMLANTPVPYGTPSSLANTREKPQGLYLLHVRLPPGYTSNATTSKPKNVHAAYYSDGTVMMVTTQQQEQDLLWSISCAPFTNSSCLVESTTLQGLDGVVFSIAEVREKSMTQHQKQTSLLRKARTPRRIALLTNEGTYIVELLKAADVLEQLLLVCQGAHHEAVKMFFKTQSEVEACTTALLLATSESLRGSEVGKWATQAFLLYGGEPCFPTTTTNPTNLANRNVMSPTTTAASNERMPMYMSTPMPNPVPLSPNHPRTPNSPYNHPISPIGQGTPGPVGPMGGGPIGGGARPVPIPQSPHGNENSPIVFSAKHDGIYVYVSRMLRSIWQQHCVDDKFRSQLNSSNCSVLLAELRALRNFLEMHSTHDISFAANGRLPYDNQVNPQNGYTSLMMGHTHPHHHHHQMSVNEQRNINEQAQIEEKRSLSALNHFVKHASEVIALWRILNDHQFQLICLQLKVDHQKMLRHCTFRDLFLTRSEICAFLIISLINLYLKDKASVTQISTSLRELCPSLYKHEDEVTYKATEILMSARTCDSMAEKEQRLRVTLQMCKDAAPKLPLHSICQQFITAEYYEGVVELTATCASKSDPEEIGIHYYNHDEPAEDRDGYACYATRMNCYEELRLMLDHVYNSASGSTKPNYTINGGTDAPAEWTVQISKILKMALRIRDPLLHVIIYKWLLAHDMVRELLEVVEPTLGDFLRRSVNRHPDNVKLIDLLWKYYEKNGHHAEAAQILYGLVKMRTDQINLEARIEYLVRAVMCMRNENVRSSACNGTFLKELEDKLEIARVQKIVLADMMTLANTNPDAQRAVKELNYAFYDISPLFQNFAEPFNLWESQLTIINCSHHFDPLLIEAVWANIINSAVSGPGTVHERSTRLFSKIEALVQRFGESGSCFPFAFLVRELEIKACQLKLSEGTVPERLFAMKLDVELLLEYYSRMISMNERVWANEGNEWQIVESATRVVGLVTENANEIWARSKRRIIGKAQDLAAVCLNICYQKPNSSRLQQTLKELQCRLHRSLS